MRLISISTTIAFGFAFQAQAATELQWWHAMTGANNEMIEELTKEFNESQSTYKVVPVFKGTYPETLNAGIAAFRSKQPPAIIQVFDAGSGTMMAAEGAIVPAAEILQKGGFTFDKSQYLPGIVAYYSKPDGTMLSFPYNSSSPILYYNKDAFQKAGLNVDNPPKTWPEVFEAAKKIKTSGAAPCGMTSTWLTWIQTENFAAWNNVPYGTNENGLGGTDVKLQINAPLYVEHFQAIADLAKDGAFRYGGRTSEAKQLFTSGECAILTESSGGLGDIAKSGVNYGIGQLPYYEGHGPQNTIPGGASLWVFAGKSDEEYKGVAEFFNFLSQTEIQAKLHQVSGYMPVTMAAYEETKKSGFYEKNPGRETPLLQMMGKAPTENSKGVRLVNLPQVRDILNEEFEAMLSGQQDAKTALDKAVERGDAAIAAAISN
ncbi:sn-glycerol-3-phosphate ABC transporter substrate-binding protein UgpB (plasmid) [Sinorhizobium meliloti WSM1022]|jgi:sn-glycerol 3-phosphate transport system substrate-binding protein|uniref:sn-glycerol-3-phosphate-binding periplasmic protein UgpB n=3 Tax=Sinorhizobium TaxID=28105 RepID=A0A220N677_RHIML|nr:MULTISPECIES: sn-glycerol-3-phosphate ABC transporter substrate-binding protein UgpB [Sinorhizobium]AEG08542.1 extracellular solute-binding protein family 1 [Sinorhizobium meliloti BL225C]AGA11297.1 ABC-type sugar transport system, periplasmic component [Sinorhizobium meliloti GR4]ASJ62792.1 sn-glycerol-3-phosphate-binding periplasmic protein UgpB [Sinorhizobium meliloti]ASP95489.1 sn-glycerol-3-phosphate-binding periplasmic protein UgpB [Sinorhizobium meliloti]MCK3786066.1 sn-glycerol-3-ph